MKFLQKATLAAAIAAAPFAAQSLEALDDATLAATTGQAGVTIEINIDAAGISVGEVEYTDTEVDTDADGINDAGGSVFLQNITVKNVTNLEQEIDVTADGDLQIGMSEVAGVQLNLGGSYTNAANETVHTSALGLKSQAGDATEVVNNISMNLDLGPQTTYIRNLAGRTAAQKTALGLPVASHDGSVAIQQTMALRINDLDVGAFGYTAAQADTLTTQLSGGVASSDVGATAKVNELINNYNTATGSSVATVGAGDTLSQAQQDAVKDTIADGSAIGINNVQFYKTEAGTDGVIGTADDVKGYATIDQTIWAKGGSAALGGGLYIQVGEIAGTLEVGGIELGGSSIGSLKVSDINLAGMTQRIYGH